MHFFVHQVVQLQIVHHAHGYLAVKRFAGAAVIQSDLGFGAVETQFLHFWIIAWIGQLEHVVDFLLFGTVEHRRSEGGTALKILGQSEDFFITKRFQVFFFTAAVIEFFQEGADFFHFALFGQHFLNALTNAFGGPAQMYFQNLTDVHA